MFHVRCLRSWLEQQQSCPTCRANLLDIEEGAVHDLLLTVGRDCNTLSAPAPAAAAAAPQAGIPPAWANLFAAQNAFPPNAPVRGAIEYY
jgi:hypothetical protein